MAPSHWMTVRVDVFLSGDWEWVNARWDLRLDVTMIFAGWLVAAL